MYSVFPFQIQLDFSLINVVSSSKDRVSDFCQSRQVPVPPTKSAGKSGYFHRREWTLVNDRFSIDLDNFTSTDVRHINSLPK